MQRTVLVIAGLIVLALIIMGGASLIHPQQKVSITDPSQLPGIMTTLAPWMPELDTLRARLSAIGLPALSAEGNALHIHQHLDLILNNVATPVPAEIGVDERDGFISPIHTHDGSGTIHVESPTIRDFTLGQFFDIWGVKFTKDCIGGYCADATHPLTVYVNGTAVTGDPRALVLAAHQEIAIVYGTTTAPVPSSFVFTAGL